MALSQSLSNGNEGIVEYKRRIPPRKCNKRQIGAPRNRDGELRRGRNGGQDRNAGENRLLDQFIAAAAGEEGKPEGRIDALPCQMADHLIEGVVAADVLSNDEDVAVRPAEGSGMHRAG